MVRCEFGHPVSGRRELGTQRGDLVVDPAGLKTVRQHTTPVGFRAGVQGVPVPVLDHGRAARDKGPRDLPPLPVVPGFVRPGEPDRLGIRFGHQKRCLLRAIHPVSRGVERPRSGGSPVLVVRLGGGQRQFVLHPVIGVTRRDVEVGGQQFIAHSAALVRDAGGDKLVVPRVLPHDVRLPGDKRGGELRLERAPGQPILRLRVAVGLPQVGPGRQAVRPVGEAPFLVEGLHGAVPTAKVINEPLEHLRVGEDLVAGLVVDLEADDRRMLGVSRDDCANHAFRVEEKGGV